MLKILLFVLLVLVLGYGFSQLAETQGSLAITVGEQLITVDLIVAAALFIGLVIVVMIVWWLIRLVFTSPTRLRRHFRSRKRDRGYQALSTGMIAAGAGDPATARKMLKQADSQLVASSEPLIQLLDAQTTMLEGKHDDARKKFEDMLEDPETRSLALRGLYMEAQRLGDRDAQRHYAEKAVELAPQLAWAGKAAVNHKTANGDWEGALRIIETQKSRNQISKEDGKRKRAVLLTAQAMDLVEAEPTRAKAAALEAHKYAPDFAPAAIVCAEAAQRLNDMRRAIKVLETCWRANPHPDVALAYVNARAGDSAIDRLKRARKLESLKPNTTESFMIVARMALEASEFEEARKAVAAVLRHEPRESAYMLMADIEDAETGNQGKMREWLARAVRAPRDPAWTADGYVSQTWAPFSPVTGEIDAFEWKVPVERLGGPLLENDDLDPMEAGPVMDGIPEISDLKTIETDDAADLLEPSEASRDADMIEAEAVPPSDADSAETTSNETDTGPEQKTADSDRSETDETTADEAVRVDADPQQAETEPESAAVDEAVPDNETDAEVSDDTPVTDADKPEATDQTRQESFTPPIPDDPGVNDDTASPDKPKRFRLF